MIAAIAWRALLIGIAVVTIGVQFDRQSVRNPAFALAVPEVFRSAAQLPVAAYAQTSDNPQAGLAAAQELVRRRPLPAEHLRLLAQAQFAADQGDQGAITIQYAAQRGWRDPLAQESMLRLALGAGDTAEAARRYAALFLRRDTQDALLEELGPAVLAEPGGEGRSTMINIVGGAERWHRRFLQRGVRVMPPDAFAEIVSATIAAGSRYDCRILRKTGSALDRRDAAAGADLAEVIDRQC